MMHHRSAKSLLGVRECNIWECNITLKDCRLCTLKTIPSVVSHLPEFYFCAHPNKLSTFPKLRWHSYVTRRTIPKMSLAVHDGVLSIQHSISIADSFAIDSVCPILGDTTDLKVWELSVKLIQGAFFKACQSEVCSFKFPSNKDKDRTGLKATGGMQVKNILLTCVTVTLNSDCKHKSDVGCMPWDQFFVTFPCHSD